MRKVMIAIYRIIRRPLILILLVVAIIFLAQRTNFLPSWKNLFSSKPLLIESTPLVVKEVKRIAELYTTHLYAEVVADSTVLNNVGIANTSLRAVGLPTLPVPEGKKIVLIVKGKVIAGIRLDQLADSAIHIVKDSIAIALPPSQILEVLTNPSDIETFLEEGDWSELERTLVKEKARRQLLQLAASQQLTLKAQQQAATVLSTWFRTIGFRAVTFL